MFLSLRPGGGFCLPAQDGHPFIASKVHDNVIARDRKKLIFFNIRFQMKPIV